MEIAWNEIIKSLREPIRDVISTAETRALAASPSTFTTTRARRQPTNASVYRTYGGCGIQLGDSPSKSDVGYTSVHDNQVVNFSGCGVSISSGHNNDVHHNRAISARTLPDGTLLNNNWRVALQFWDNYWDPLETMPTVADPFWHDNWMHDNLFNAVSKDGTASPNNFYHFGPTVGEYNNVYALGHLATTDDGAGGVCPLEAEAHRQRSHRRPGGLSVDRDRGRDSSRGRLGNDPDDLHGDPFASGGRTP